MVQEAVLVSVRRRVSVRAEQPRKSMRQLMTRLIRLKWVLMGFGAAAFAGFGVTGGVLADAGWDRIIYVTAPLAIAGWVAAAFGVGLHVYDLSRKNSN